MSTSYIDLQFSGELKIDKENKPTKYTIKIFDNRFDSHININTNHLTMFEEDYRNSIYKAMDAEVDSI